MGKTSKMALTAAMTLFTVATVKADSSHDSALRRAFDNGIRYSPRIDFPGVTNGADPVLGQAKFGLSSDGTTIDPSQGTFSGTSVIAGPIVSNGRTCASCHRPDAKLGLPAGRLSDSIPADDAVFTGLAADIGTEPLGTQMFDEHGLLFHRPGRFNPTFPADDPFRQVFFWRKSTHVVNTVLTFGFLNDGRARDLVETTRGAIFTHTQNGDARFDDIADPQTRDIAAFMETQFDPPELKDMLDPNAPLHDVLISDPFYTVHASTPLERKGQNVFAKNCMSCHNMPNVFGNTDHADGPPLNFAPGIGHAMDIGVAQQNMLHLEFRRFDTATGQRVPVVLPLAAQDGRTVMHTVTDDVGLAATTGRYEDLHRFKVPQLRRISQLGPYFHDNSAPTLEAVVDYFDSDAYNSSPDGRKYPIHLNRHEKEALLAFLRIL